MYYTYYQWTVLYQVYTLNDDLSPEEMAVPTESYFLLFVYIILLFTQLIGLLLNFFVCCGIIGLVTICISCLDPNNHLVWNNGLRRRGDRHGGGASAHSHEQNVTLLDKMQKGPVKRTLSFTCKYK